MEATDPSPLGISACLGKALDHSGATFRNLPLINTYGPIDATGHLPSRPTAGFLRADCCRSMRLRRLAVTHPGTPERL